MGTEIGILGKISPLETKDDIFVAEINLDKLLSIRTSKIQFVPINKYPAVVKDLSFIIDKKIEAQKIVDQIKQSGGKNLNKIEIFDVYMNENIGINNKSIALKLTFVDDKKTLTDEEVNINIDKIIKNVVNKFNAKLRDDNQ